MVVRIPTSSTFASAILSVCVVVTSGHRIRPLLLWSRIGCRFKVRQVSTPQPNAGTRTGDFLTSTRRTRIQYVSERQFFVQHWRIGVLDGILQSTWMCTMTLGMNSWCYSSYNIGHPDGFKSWRRWRWHILLRKFTHLWLTSSFLLELAPLSIFSSGRGWTILKQSRKTKTFNELSCSWKLRSSDTEDLAAKTIWSSTKAMILKAQWRDSELTGTPTYKRRGIVVQIFGLLIVILEFW